MTLKKRGFRHFTEWGCGVTWNGHFETPPPIRPMTIICFTGARRSFAVAVLLSVSALVAPFGALARDTGGDGFWLPPVGSTATVKVVKVKDGDTIGALYNSPTGPVEVPVRFAEIDAPEKTQAFGQVAKAKLSDLVFGKEVTVTVVDWDTKWKNGERAVGIVSVGGGEVNLWMVRNGYAWCYDRYSKRGEVKQAQLAAQAERRGLWVDPSPIAPWLYRREQKAVGGEQ